eukprot:TRINITY_DN23506_c0_g2_i1.p1 TRINITY_DN23506_c0_g2~~TRINITY_DN23506_c0_g2_i1.p1  ORF type:complete len:562 (+),score=63.88 TRINITY_DN23506_c0_g2_i1:150-1688(+)
MTAEFTHALVTLSSKRDKHEHSPFSDARSAKRSRVSFQFGSVAARRCKVQLDAFVVGDISDDETTSCSQPKVVVADIESASSSGTVKKASGDPSAVSAVDGIVTSSPTTSSLAFENFRGSLAARTSPLFRRYCSLVGGERGLSGGVDSGLLALGIGGIGCVVDAMVQLADFRAMQSRKGGPRHERSNSAVSEIVTGETTEDELVDAACELFEALCHSVAEVAQSHTGVPSESYIDTLRCQWRLGAAPAVANSEGLMEQTAARAAALFRMKDTIASLYGWSLLTRSAAAEVVRVVCAEVATSPEDREISVRMIDPIAGSGLHGGIFRKAGASVVLADSVGGGSTQTSEVDMHRIAHFSRPTTGSVEHASAASQASIPPPSLATVPYEPVSRVIWEEAERRCVFDASAEACAWWQQHSSSRSTLDAHGRRSDVDATEDVLLLSFPPPSPSTVAEVCLQRFRGNWTAFIGEWRGCTGTVAFFDSLERDWDVQCKLEIPRWPMMDDRVYLLRRRTH